jgi:hypothetical protein
LSTKIDRRDEKKQEHEKYGEKCAKHNVNEIQHASWKVAQPKQWHTLVGGKAQITAVFLMSQVLLEKQDGYENIGRTNPNTNDNRNARAKLAYAKPARAHFDRSI